jgi:hypothetical protein
LVREQALVVVLAPALLCAQAWVRVSVGISEAAWVVQAPAVLIRVEVSARAVLIRQVAVAWICQAEALMTVAVSMSALWMSEETSTVGETSVLAEETSVLAADSTMGARVAAWTLAEKECGKRKDDALS